MDSLQFIAFRIKKLADNNHVSLNKMLIDSKAGERTYHNILAGSKPSAEKLVRIANYFNCSVDYLLGRTDNPEINR